ncbi:MAG: S8 family serine peptidase [Clostridiales bacterium]|jgi:uncharacterized repeat protein (TIGR02543 family)|nr:S8 family serine peptidase [Clostridiales bacterium]
MRPRTNFAIAAIVAIALLALIIPQNTPIDSVTAMEIVAVSDTETPAVDGTAEGSSAWRQILAALLNRSKEPIIRNPAADGYIVQSVDDPSEETLPDLELVDDPSEETLPDLEQETEPAEERLEEYDDAVHTFRDDVARLISETTVDGAFDAIELKAGESELLKNGEPAPVVEDKELAPVLENGVMLVPLATLVNNSEAEVSYNYDSAAIQIPDGDIALTAGEDLMKVNGEDVELPAEAKVLDEEMFVPLEEVAGALGYEVERNGEEAVLSRPFQFKRLIVKTEPWVDHINTYEASVHLFNSDALHVLQYETEAMAREACLLYQDDPGIIYAEPDAIARAEYFSWGVEAMGAPEYQEWLAGTMPESLTEVVVGVIDTGIDSDHPFLSGRISPNDYNYYTGERSSYDASSHGTHVSGVIVDATPQNVKVRPYKVFDDNGDSTWAAVVLAIKDAVNDGVDVINMSIGTASRGTLDYVEDAVNEALQNNISVVVAAGNSYDDAARHTPSFIEAAVVVAAVDQNDKRPSYSNYGSTVDISAAGVDVVSSVLNGKYEPMSGTSMASPHVAAAAAMLKTYNKALSAMEIENILKNSARDIGDPGWDRYYGNGALNMRSLPFMIWPAEPTFTPIPPLTPSPTFTPSPTEAPSPTFTPTPSPIKAPTFTPTPSPTKAPASTPTPSPTKAPAFTPTSSPTKAPSPTPELPKTYTVSYRNNGGNGFIPNKIANMGSSMIISEPIWIVKTGYVFAGWSTSSDGNGKIFQPRQSVSFSENTTLYAMWKK